MIVNLVEMDVEHERDFGLAKQISAVLIRHYPGYTWRIEVLPSQGIIRIVCYDLTATFGYVLHLAGSYSWDSLRDAVMRAGGELLERFDVIRGRRSPDEFATKPRDFTGQVIGDVTTH